MRSIVAVFALSLAACAPFGTDSLEPEPSEDEPAAVKTKDKKPPAISKPAPSTRDEPMGLAAPPSSKLFKPTTLPAPAIVVLHGSEGGADPRYEAFARGLADQGFVVVAMCWFGCDGRPSVIDHIPLDAIAEAGTAAKLSPDTNGKVGLFGWGRGAEAALVLTAATKTEPFHAVAVHASTDLTAGGFDPKTQDIPPSFGELATQAWTFGTTTFSSGVRIPVESYAGPMLVTHGIHDDVWPLERASNIIEARIENGPGLVTEHEFFNDGHVPSTPSLEAELRSRVASFFHEQLGGAL